MSAIITDQFRRNSVKTLIADTGNDYYIGIGKSDAWPDQSGISENSASFVPPGPYGSIYEKAEALENLISIAKATASDMRHVIPKITLETGNKYKVWDPNDDDCFFASDDGSGGTILPCYAYYPSNNAFYICLRNGGASPVVTANLPGSIPTDSAGDPTYEAEALADGYIWVYVETFENNSPFDTAQYQAIVGNPSVAEQANASDSTGGMLYGFSVQDGGSGYTAIDTTVKFIGTVLDSAGNEDIVEISSEDSADPLTFSVSGGAIEYISLGDPTNPASFTKGIIKGSVVIEDTSSNPGTGAKVIPMIAPQNGFGYSPIDDLPTFFLGLSAEFDATQGGDALLIPYRQISVIKNPGLSSDGDGDLTTADCLPWLIADTEPSSLSTGDLMKIDNGSGVEPTYVFYDSHDDNSNGTFNVYFHQNQEIASNTGPVPATGSVTDINDTALFAYTSVEEPEYDRRTGEVIFIENRKPIVRSSAQNEKLKIIIQY